MKAVSVRELKNNPSAALRAAREHPVMVLNRHEPEAMLIHLRDDSVLGGPGVRQAIATALFRERSLSLGLAAKFSGLGIAGFIEHVSRLGIPVVAATAEAVRDGRRVCRNMARRLVVADASPLIGLAAAGAFDLLRRL